MAALILLAGIFVFSLLGHFVLGKRSVLNCAVSSAIGIIFIYAVSIVLRSAGEPFNTFITPLPLVSFTNEQMKLFSFTGAHYTAICSEVLSMIILSFLVNLADGWLPRGKNIISWILFRCLTVFIAYLMHLITIGLMATYLPESILTYAPVILLGILIVLLLTGILKILVGAVLTTVNPIIGGLYTFFFATIIGKQITKAVLTTAMLSGLVIALQYIGFGVISIASAALVAYIPIMIVLLLLWYIICILF